MRGAHNVSFSTTSIPLILAATSGVLSATSILFPSLFFLIWMAFVPFFLSLSGRSASQRILLGLTTGLMYFGVAYYWVCLSTLTFFAFSPFVALVLFIGSLVRNGFVFVLFAVALRQPSSTSRQLLFAALPWVVLEHYYPTLVPWQLGAILQPHLAAFQLAEFTGGAGLSFLIVLVNGWLFRAHEQYRVGAVWGGFIVAAIGVVLALAVHGRWRLAQLEAETWSRTLSVAIVQGNAPPLSIRQELQDLPRQVDHAGPRRRATTFHGRVLRFTV